MRIKSQFPSTVPPLFLRYGEARREEQWFSRGNSKGRREGVERVARAPHINVTNIAFRKGTAVLDFLLK